MKRIHKVVITKAMDEDADDSYLEQKGFDNRARQYRDGLFGFIGIYAHAEYFADGNLRQIIKSGGLWGIESDSDAAYLKEIEQEQLSELRDQLHAIGFGNRAINAAFRDLRREEN